MNVLDAGFATIETRISNSIEFLDVVARTAFAMQGSITNIENGGEVCHVHVPVGDASIAQFQSGGGAEAYARRSWTEIRADNTQFHLFWFPMRGGICLVQNGLTATADCGSIAIGRSNAPYHVRTIPDSGGEHMSLMLSVPAHLARTFLPSIDRLSCSALT